MNKVVAKCLAKLQPFWLQFVVFKATIASHYSMKHSRISNLLLNEFKRRNELNYRYSFRAFAKSLGISHSSLSMFLSGKRGISKNSVNRILAQLGFQQDLIDLRNDNAKERTDRYFVNELSFEHYTLISNWVHYAILSWLDLPGGSLDARLIAKNLSVDVENVNECIERLKKLKIIEKKRNGRWKQVNGPIKVDNSVAQHAVTNNHKVLIAKSLDAINRARFSERGYSGVVLSFPKKDMDRARKMISEFRENFTKEFSTKRCDSVYALLVQFFPLTGADE